MLTILKYAVLIVAALVLIVIVTLMFLFWGRGQLVYAEDKEGVAYLHRKGGGNQVSVQQALDLAGPFLQNSLELIRKNRGTTNPDWGGRSYVVLKADWYYLFKDDYPWKAPELELPGRYEGQAIRVHKETGELLLPHL